MVEFEIPFKKKSVKLKKLIWQESIKFRLGRNQRAKILKVKCLENHIEPPAYSIIVEPPAHSIIGKWLFFFMIFGICDPSYQTVLPHFRFFDFKTSI
jgi:hypothetical protein